MIKKLVYDGDPKELNENGSVQTILSRIDDEEIEYFVGVDLANEDSSDFSAITKYKLNTDGTYVYYGTEVI